MTKRRCPVRRAGHEVDLELAPNHLVDDAGVGLDDLHDFRRYILVHIVRDGDAVVTVLVQLDGGIHGLQ